ncbi:zinc-ribbon domain-containing protein [Tengunoibacter tsumagoiensis]|uniref:Zinc-ribbon 15 domain-containing protein n=1 Tax=Tengunoibacter tsumagoiensis TaxID=2014871 RepID=A0A402A522_9CHLR|nr:zinc-ribbon domain-containing protein [Tengunoibacter tsumagoiensis]GCE14156.1 hypothetical protein KTT_40150 [Tengunoibacter tsumagoiensis]
MIIWGLRSRNKVLGQVQYTCSRCGNNSFHSMVRYRRWFTLFFIPLIPFNTRTISRCNICGFQENIANQRANELIPH